MKTIIKITKQEALDAWKDINYDKVKGKDIIVEIEESFTSTIRYAFNPTIPAVNQCLVCKQYVGNLIAHVCGGSQPNTCTTYTTC